MPIKGKASNSHYIGTLNEKSLHAALKKWYTSQGDELEVAVDGYYIDIVRDGELIEIQTRNFSSIKKKLTSLVEYHPVRLVHPIAQEKWLYKLPITQDDEPIRRKSPRCGTVYDILDELVSFPMLLTHQNFTLELLFIKEEEVRSYDPKRGWRKHGWITQERRLLEVINSLIIRKPSDLLMLLPDDLQKQFTTEHIALSLGRSQWFARKLVYCLKKMNLIKKVGTRNRFYLYEKV